MINLLLALEEIYRGTPPGRWRGIIRIVWAWIFTLPVTALLGYICALVAER